MQKFLMKSGLVLAGSSLFRARGDKEDLLLVVDSGDCLPLFSHKPPSLGLPHPLKRWYSSEVQLSVSNGTNPKQSFLIHLAVR